MAPDHLTYLRRNIRERETIRLLRGGEIAGSAKEGNEHPQGAEPRGRTLSSYQSAHFGCLRHFCQRNLIEIRPLSSLYIAADELAVLRWLAEAQRSAGLRSCYIRDLGLRTSIQHCATLLKELGVSLPTQTLYIYSRLNDRRTGHHTTSKQKTGRDAGNEMTTQAGAETLIGGAKREYPPS